MNKNYTIQKAPCIVPTSDGKLIAEHPGNTTDKNSILALPI